MCRNGLKTSCRNDMKPKLLLIPISYIYAAVMSLRNLLYDNGIFYSQSFPKPVICVGNITVGGTGKTPLIEFLILNLLKFKPSVVSRGYRRKTKGFVLANRNSSTDEIGDEPHQLLEKFPSMPIAVDADRANAINFLLQNTDTQVVLMDDGFQHRSVRAGLNIVVVDYARPMWSDHVFPAGRLREPMKALSRVNIVVVNKCPVNLSVTEKNKIAAKFRLNENQQLYFSAIHYGEPRLITGNKIITKNKVVAVAGIGRPQPFFDETARRYCEIRKIAFADHHDFNDADIEKIKNALAQLGDDSVVITTEKDAQRFKNQDFTIYALPIELSILFNEHEKFNNTIIDYVTKNQ